MLRVLAGLSGSDRGDSQGKHSEENAAIQPERSHVHDSASDRGRHSADDRPRCPLNLNIHTPLSAGKYYELIKY